MRASTSSPTNFDSPIITVAAASGTVLFTSDMFTNCLFVMIGGAIGALLRYAVSLLTADIRFCSLPAGTLCVNIAGCLLLGLLTAVGENHTTLPRHVMLMLTTGVCGAFTTFSTFSAETIKTAENGHVWHAAAYVGTSLTLGFLAFWWGKSHFSAAGI